MGVDGDDESECSSAVEYPEALATPRSLDGDADDGRMVVTVESAVLLVGVDGTDTCTSLRDAFGEPTAFAKALKT